MLSSRAYDAVYRSNGSPLKKKPNANETSAHKNQQHQPQYSPVSSYKNHLSHDRLDNYDRRGGDE